jgi:hypothetical protein
VVTVVLLRRSLGPLITFVVAVAAMSFAERGKKVPLEEPQEKGK